jgi:hypothetical protein
MRRTNVDPTTPTRSYLREQFPGPFGPLATGAEASAPKVNVDCTAKQRQNASLGPRWPDWDALSMLGTTREVLCEVVRYGTPGGWDATMASGLNWWVGHPDGCGCNGEEKKVRVPGSTWGMSTSKKKCSDETLCEECLRL